MEEAKEDLENYCFRSNKLFFCFKRQLIHLKSSSSFHLDGYWIIAIS